MKRIVLESDRTISYRPEIAKLLDSETAALVFQQLGYWASKMNFEWFYKSNAEIEEETYLSRYKVRNAISKLEAMEWVSTCIKQVNGVPTKHFMVNARLTTVISESTKTANGKYKNSQSIYKENNRIHTKDIYIGFIERLNTILKGGKIRDYNPRITKLKQRLEKFSEDELILAATTLSTNAWMMGDNPSNKKYANIDYLLRNNVIPEDLLNNSNSSVKANGWDEWK